MPSPVKNHGSKFVTRRGSVEDLPHLQKLYTDTIQEVCRNDYNQAQLAAWAAGVENKERWQAIFTDQFVIVALAGDEIIGFASLDKGVHIDMFYVHRDFQGRGVASLLYSKLETEAIAKGATMLNGNISRTARRFFEHKGFVVDNEQTFAIRGVMISNFKMSKDLK